ncbi:MAG: peptide-methionine (S)-S-oxide reductase MsrA [Rubricoccaceae bacterium]|nr:peptide-methionine (S)-S-oxide reductase MsrA [Rubricoccaceae bacterium]
MKRFLTFPLALACLFTLTALGCSQSNASHSAEDDEEQTASVEVANPQTAVFAMGCFWCAETAFEGREGIVSVVSGFSGGTVENPSYDEVTRGGTGHYEVIEVTYDADVVSYEELLYIFWRNVDPFDPGGQFCDRGDSYRSAIFATEAQRPAAEESLAEVEARFDAPIATRILDAAPFYPAEDYHQDFYRKDPDRYYSYRIGCRRDARLEAVWGDEKMDDVVSGRH